MTSLSIILMDVILLVFLLMLSIPLPVCFAGALLFLSLFGDVSMKTMLIWVFSQSTGTVPWPVPYSSWRERIWAAAG